VLSSATLRIEGQRLPLGLFPVAASEPNRAAVVVESKVDE
jgi:hypothetical protein